MTTHIKAVGFDWGGVLYGKPGWMFSQGAADVLGVPHEDFQRAYFTHYVALTTGVISSEAFWRIVLSTLGKDERYTEIITYLSTLPKKEPNKEVISLVQELKSKDFILGILSNNSREKGNGIRQSEIAHYFDVIMVSEEIGYAKPQQEAFELFATALGIHLSELVYIDDTPQSISSAQEVGYTPIIYTSGEDLRKQLAIRNIL